MFPIKKLDIGVNDFFWDCCVGLILQAKDIMFYLYNVARANMAKSIPKEIQILRRLLAIEDPRERFEEMTVAFSPGDDKEGKEMDGLYT